MWAASFCGALIISIASVHAQRTEPLRFNLGSLRVDTIVQEAFSSKAGASVVNRA